MSRRASTRSADLAGVEIRPYRPAGEPSWRGFTESERYLHVYAYSREETRAP